MLSTKHNSARRFAKSLSVTGFHCCHTAHSATNRQRQRPCCSCNHRILSENLDHQLGSGHLSPLRRSIAPFWSGRSTMESALSAFVQASCGRWPVSSSNFAARSRLTKF
jgi:hypothetical protein